MAASRSPAKSSGPEERVEALNDARTAVQRSIDEARHRLVQARSTDRDEWRDLIDRSLSAALEQEDPDGLAATVQFMSMLLDAEGRFDEALAEFDHALTLSRGSPTATGLLEALRSAGFLATGRHAEAAESLRRSEELLTAAGEHAGIRWPVIVESVRLKMLLKPSQRLPALLGLGSSTQAQADYTFLLSWYIPYLAATGDLVQARPLIQLGRATAKRLKHRWRRADMQAFEQWTLAVEGEIAGKSPGHLVSPTAELRAAALSLWCASLRRDLPAITEADGRLRQAKDQRATMDHGEPDAWTAWARVMVGDRSLLARLHPPPRATLANLGAGLVAAHAVAIAGSREDARVWLLWLRKLGDLGVESSLEWPVARQRIEALLLLRTGAKTRARIRMRHAVAWAAQQDYPAEHAIARLQAEGIGTLVQRPGPRAAPEPEDDVIEYLVARAIDPWPHVAAVESAALEGEAKERPLLTGREIEVLRLLAEDKSYREAAAVLGLSWQTVRGTAYRIYQKLGTSTKHAAAQEGRRLGLL